MYLNEAQISLTGYIATQPVVRTVNSGAANLTMRVGWTPRRQDRVTGEWADGNTSYVTVVCWRRLATNAAVCLRKGDPVVVKGRLSIRTYDDKQGNQRTAVEVEASSVGHDLSRGVTQFQRVRSQTGLTAAQFAAREPGADGDAQQGGDLRTASPGVTEPGDPEFPLPGEPGDADDPFFSDTAVSGDVPEAEQVAAPS